MNMFYRAGDPHAGDQFHREGVRRSRILHLRKNMV